MSSVDFATMRQENITMIPVVDIPNYLVSNRTLKRIDGALTDDHLHRGEDEPHSHISPSLPRTPGHDTPEELLVKSVLCGVPSSEKASQYHAHKRNGIFETRTIIYRLRMLVHHDCT
jgi:hypothetical protein